MAKRDYRKFLQFVPERYKICLEFAVDRVRYAVTDDPSIIFAYDGKKDEIQYNPNHPKFDAYDFRIANTHELAHKIDKYFVQSIRRPDFVAAVQNARRILDADSQFFVQYCEQNDREGVLSDILSAICNNEYDFPMGHPASYWTPNTQILECYANLLTLEAINDVQKLKFLEEYFPDLLNSFRALEFNI